MGNIQSIYYILAYDILVYDTKKYAKNPTC